MTTDDSPPSSSFFHSSFYHDNARPPLKVFEPPHSPFLDYVWCKSPTDEHAMRKLFHIFMRIKTLAIPVVVWLSHLATSTNATNSLEVLLLVSFTLLQSSKTAHWRNLLLTKYYLSPASIRNLLLDNSMMTADGSATGGVSFFFFDHDKVRPGPSGFLKSISNDAGPAPL